MGMLMFLLVLGMGWVERGVLGLDVEAFHVFMVAVCIPFYEDDDDNVFVVVGSCGFGGVESCCDCGTADGMWFASYMIDDHLTSS
jgi:hypothetical protein